MVSNVRLAQMHLRLEQIFCGTKDERDSFGGVNIMLLEGICYK
jgi:hypothetical protein